MDSLGLLRDATNWIRSWNLGNGGWINYQGTKEDFLDNWKEAMGADNLSDITEFQSKIKSGQLPPKLVALLKKRQKELMDGKAGSRYSWGQ